MPPKRRQGRPRLNPEQVRRFLIGVMVNADERRQVRRAAEAEDLSMSAWIRACVLEALRKRRG